MSIIAENQELNDICLDFISFLLRYNKDLDYTDFSDDPNIISKIKRAELFRTWSDVEDLANQMAEIQMNLSGQQVKQLFSIMFQNTISSSIQELFQKYEQMKREEQLKKQDYQKDLQKINIELLRLKEYSAPLPAQKQQTKLDSMAALDMINEVKVAMSKLIENKIIDLEFNLNNKIVYNFNLQFQITRIENIERNSDMHLRTAQILENRYTIDSRRMDKIEETMHDQISIIESMSRRQKSFMDSQEEFKKNLMIRLQRLENDFITKTFEALDAKFDFQSFEHSIKKLQGDVDVFRVEHLTFKEIASGKIDNLDTIFKKVANDSFNKTREVETQLVVWKDEVLKVTEDNIRDIQAMNQKLDGIATEVIEMKNEKRALTNLKQKIHWASDAQAKVEALVEETNNLYSFMQKFIDEHAVNKAKKLRNSDINLKEKMSVMDWLSRNADFLSAAPIQDCILAFKEIYQTDNATLKNAYIFAKHSSNVIQTLLLILEQVVDLPKDDELTQKVTVMFSILEPLLINDQNLEKCLNFNGFQLMLRFITSNVVIDKPPVYIKYCVRCMTSCLRHETVRDEEILANACKIFRICMREEQNLEFVVTKRKDIGNILVETLQSHQYSEAISQEVLSVINLKINQ
ncbi:UNKNOWN [Stylonychia lemnae]|uniref:Uncharacterized protein n=1 Tax=Stylonychia lemnae TaxID=5949 RepID=A0A077ZUZ4_STYLE|nr:UNKNOWN [Stylonychia lemnae]|eukprot:CDW73709.1 UNKNOWN [Stylonychia lemnae]